MTFNKGDRVLFDNEFTGIERGTILAVYEHFIQESVYEFIPHGANYSIIAFESELSPLDSREDV